MGLIFSLLFKIPVSKVIDCFDTQFGHLNNWMTCLWNLWLGTDTGGVIKINLGHYPLLPDWHQPPFATLRGITHTINSFAPSLPPLVPTLHQPILSSQNEHNTTTRPAHCQACRWNCEWQRCTNEVKSCNPCWLGRLGLALRTAQLARVKLCNHSLLEGWVKSLCALISLPTVIQKIMNLTQWAPHSVWSPVITADLTEQNLMLRDHLIMKGLKLILPLTRNLLERVNLGVNEELNFLLVGALSDWGFWIVPIRGWKVETALWKTTYPLFIMEIHFLFISDTRKTPCAITINNL